MSNVILLVSGGLDSAVMDLLLRMRGHDVLPVRFNYRDHAKEMVAADDLYGDRLMKIGAEDAVQECVGDGNTEHNLFFFRNGVLISLAVALAMREGYDTVATGIFNEPELALQDADLTFLNLLDPAVQRGSHGRVSLHKEWLTKEQAFDYADRAGEFARLSALAWTCRYDASRQCGKCHQCDTRIKAVDRAGVLDSGMERTGP